MQMIKHVHVLIVRQIWLVIVAYWWLQMRSSDAPHWTRGRRRSLRSEWTETLWVLDLIWEQLSGRGGHKWSNDLRTETREEADLRSVGLRLIITLTFVLAANPQPHPGRHRALRQQAAEGGRGLRPALQEEEGEEGQEERSGRWAALLVRNTQLRWNDSNEASWWKTTHRWVFTQMFI